MKISRRNHPILECIEKKSFGKFYVYPENERINSNIKIIDGSKKNFEEQAKIFFKEDFKINYLSDSFIQSYKKAQEFLFKSTTFSDIPSGSFCLLIGLGFDLCMRIENNIEKKHIEVMSFGVKKSDIKDESVQYECLQLGATDFFYDEIPGSLIKTTAFEGYYSDMYRMLKTIDKENNLDGITDFLIQNLIILLFLKYAKIETKILEPNKKCEGEIGVYYKNETDLKINHIDSKWFTTLVQSEGFNVRGHFRLQPKKKDGKWTREIIWINPFHKDGYTAPARKIKQFPEIE